MQVGLTAALLGTQESPIGDSVYGTPRTFQATVANLGTQTDIQGNLTFFAGATPICTAPFLPNNTLVGTTVSASLLYMWQLCISVIHLSLCPVHCFNTCLASLLSNICFPTPWMGDEQVTLPVQVALNNLDPAFAVDLLNAIALGNSGLPASTLNILAPLLNSVTTLLNIPINALNLPTILNTLGLGLQTVTINAGVVATCTTATLPVGPYTGLTVAYAGEHSPSACHLIFLQ
jgi:hypothetical protein